MNRMAVQKDSESHLDVLIPQQQECFTCRIIGTTALGVVGAYALNQSRAHQPGSIVGKRIMAGVGACFLVASAFRWTKSAPKT